jgi:queuine/archaeosine tRNA-ribosyltransferase
MFHMPLPSSHALFQVKGSPVQELRETQTETEAETCILHNTDVYASLRARVRTNVREHEIVVNAYAGQSARGRSGFELT